MHSSTENFYKSSFIIYASVFFVGKVVAYKNDVLIITFPIITVKFKYNSSHNETVTRT